MHVRLGGWLATGDKVKDSKGIGIGEGTDRRQLR